MADQKLTALTRLTTLAGADYGYVVDDPTGTPASKYFQLQDIVQVGPLNYKITPTVASNNLTVALKTLAGNDPSATDPLIFKIGDTWRACTAATSITLNAGTNYFDSGVTFAAQERDYFVYAVWNTGPATDILDLSISPFCHFSKYSDGSATATDANYLPYGAGTAPAAADDFVVIGRFAATLSAGAGYTWSVPTYTTINLVQRPVYESRVLSYVPAWTNLTVGAGTVTAKYAVMGRFCSMTLALVFAADTSIGGAGVTATIPFARTAFYGGSTRSSFGLVRLNDADTSTGYAGVFQAAPSATTAAIVAQGAGGTYLTFSALDTTVPFTWAVNDQILIDNVRYSIGL